MSIKGLQAIVLPLFVLTGAVLSGAQPSPEPAEIMRATVVMERYEARLFKLPAVVGMGIAASREDGRQLVVEIYVSRKLDGSEIKKFPRQLEGVPVRVEVTGEVSALPRSKSKSRQLRR